MRTQHLKHTSPAGVGHEEVIHQLNLLLADYHVFYMNVRGFHWNVRGRKFFELHAKFEELYKDLAEKIDEIAERVLMLGGTPDHTFSTYLQLAAVMEVKNCEEGARCAQHILHTLQFIMEKQRELLRLTAEVEDEGTNGLMSDYIREQEKLAWMYAAYLNE